MREARAVIGHGISNEKYLLWRVGADRVPSRSGMQESLAFFLRSV